MSNCFEQTFCLACGSEHLELVLDLKSQPLANSYKKQADDAENSFPLAVNLCTNCYHLQLTHIVDPSIIYSNYLYVAGTSNTLKQYSNWFANYVSECIDIKTNSVLDIGCNDGTQLDSFKKLGYKTFGVDPAENIFPTSSKNHEVLCRYFGENVVSEITSEFDAITAQNVFAHNPNPLEFLLTCKKLMSDHTLLFIQTSQANMVLNNEFDTIYHEHVSFFNVNSMNILANRAGLNLIDSIKTPIHGTSYIFVLSKTKKRDSNIKNVIDQENKLLLLDTYDKWRELINKNTNELKNTLNSFKAQGYKLVGYGAAAKGNTLLNYIKIKLDFIIDDNSLKQNLYTPGQCIPIKSIEALNSMLDDDKIIFVPLAWNFFNEIKSRILKSRTNSNDKFLKYFPYIEVVNV
jgi:SAM-dependent methyltransferase